MNTLRRILDWLRRDELDDDPCSGYCCSPSGAQDRDRRRRAPQHIRGHLEAGICTDHGAHEIDDDQAVTFTEAQAMRR